VRGISTGRSVCSTRLSTSLPDPLPPSERSDVSGLIVRESVQLRLSMENLGARSALLYTSEVFFLAEGSIYDHFTLPFPTSRVSPVRWSEI
jgi:hypothetical protein